MRTAFGLPVGKLDLEARVAARVVVLSGHDLGEGSGLGVDVEGQRLDYVADRHHMVWASIDQLIVLNRREAWIFSCLLQFDVIMQIS